NVNNLTHDYGHGRGVFDVTFEVTKGETLGFLGPNGAGKSTTMRHLMGFSSPQKGSVSIDGLNCTKNSSKIMQSVGYLPGEVALPEGLSGDEFIKMMQGMRKTKNDENVKALLERFRLDPKSRVKKMSIGEKRKLAVVAAFMDDPDILLLDEPTSGLDPLMQEVFIDFIKEQKQKGKTILLSSHIFSEVEALCDRIAIIKDGRLVSTVTSAEIAHGLHNIMTVGFENEADFESFGKAPLSFKLKDRSSLKCSVIVDDEDINKFVSFIKDKKLRFFDEHSVTLEEYFMHYYTTDKRFGGISYV
ncbi:MAG: ABC transporter ATP-binding protein, partial [Ruminococcus sp.]|nr:ABC transporter ATP-binding protein [Ruminococcus sp.]